jgi:hypothetical protein
MDNNIYPGLGSLARISDARTRVISAENVYGRKGAAAMAVPGDTPQEDVRTLGQTWESGHPARELGQGWKVRPCLLLEANSVTTIMDVDGPGVIQHMWFTVDNTRLRDLVLRIYWDHEETPSVEVPLGDFFCDGWCSRAVISALPINVNPQGGMNSYFPMPFRTHARMTVEHLGPVRFGGFFYTITYAETPVAVEDGYFHASFRRSNPLRLGSDHVILDGVKGQGHYVGTYMAWQQNNTGWWGEGEAKFFIDGDKDFPTIAGTGTEDYFGGAWCFGSNYSAPFLGYPQGSSDGKPGNRHGLYRFHVLDPIRFASDLRVTMQALGWRKNERYLPLQDDIASVAYWYQREPHAPFPPLPDRNGLEVI